MAGDRVPVVAGVADERPSVTVGGAELAGVAREAGVYRAKKASAPQRLREHNPDRAPSGARPVHSIRCSSRSMPTATGI